jgi:NAD(P)-dependent dehydrogenase (short-subunit alcohol dehydrogenase family)
MRALEGMRALVTGGGTGIGFGIAGALLEGGATVTIAGRREDVLERAAAALHAEFVAADAAGAGAGSHPAVRTVRCDVTVESDVAEAVAVAAGPDGRLDVAVANAGSAVPGPFLLLDDAGWRFCCELNIIGTASTFRHAARAMTDGGSLIAISTAASNAPEVGMAAYSATKAAVDMMVRSAAWELGPRRIRVNAIQPGYVPTDATQGAFSDDVIADLATRVALAQPGRADDIAALAVHLAGPGGSWITGQVIAVDGGLSVQPMADLSDISVRMYGADVVADALGRTSPHEA